jgi:hypothetical protein
MKYIIRSQFLNISVTLAGDIWDASIFRKLLPFYRRA